MPFLPRKILITGAGGNLGGAIIGALSAKGRRFVLHYATSKKKVMAISEAVRETGALCFPVQAKFRSAADAEKLVRKSVKLMGGLDCVIHLAAVFEKTPLATTTEQQWDRILDCDLKMPFFIAKASASAMQKKGGRMVFFSDVAATRIYREYLPYSIAKAGVDALVKGLSKILPPRFQVNVIAPYKVEDPTKMAERVLCCVTCL